jgi:ribosomal protein S18 acetylase RimI-like enzyme
MDNIENNLYEFYRIFASLKNNLHLKEHAFEMALAKNKMWPQMIFTLNRETKPEEIIPAMIAYLEDKKPAPFLIAPESFISRNQTGLLKAHSLLPVKLLMGMNFHPDKTENITLPPDCEVKELTQKTQFRDFYDLIRKEFFSSEPSFDSDNLPGLKARKEIQMIGLYSNNVLVSALMILTQLDVAGLYFIVTRKDDQKKGYATLLIKSVLSQCFEKGIKEVVLHANNNSFGLYRKLGFNPQNRFIIYKKV